MAFCSVVVPFSYSASVSGPVIDTTKTPHSPKQSHNLGLVKHVELKSWPFLSCVSYILTHDRNIGATTSYLPFYHSS
jgi:hypothetical protein